MSLSEISEECQSSEELMAAMTRVYTQSAVQKTEEDTRGQNESNSWFKYRVGVVTASKAHSVFTKVNTIKKSQDDQVDKTSLLNTLLGKTSVNANVKSLQYGRAMDPEAVNTYENLIKKCHKF